MKHHGSCCLSRPKPVMECDCAVTRAKKQQQQHETVIGSDNGLPVRRQATM